MQVIRDLSPTAAARRVQIVEAAIDTLAELGYANTSFAKIAARAGISSTRLISYHFAGKDELMRAVADEVLQAAAAAMRPRIEAAAGSWERLAAYIAGNLAFLAERPNHLRAIVEVVGNTRTPGAPNPAVTLLEQAFIAGQADGEFRAFDPRVMAITVRAAIDAAAAGPAPDLAHYADELVSLFGHAVRK